MHGWGVCSLSLGTNNPGWAVSLGATPLITTRRSRLYFGTIRTSRSEWPRGMMFRYRLQDTVTRFLSLLRRLSGLIRPCICNSVCKRAWMAAFFLAGEVPAFSAYMCLCVCVCGSLTLRRRAFVRRGGGRELIRISAWIQG